MNFCGIDPGINGGMATIDYEGHVLDVRRMPKTKHGIDEEGIWKWANWLNTLPCKSVVWIEKVSGYIGNAHPGSTMFEFGVSYGGLKMAVLASKGTLPNEVDPRDWQRYLGIEPRRKKKVKRKYNAIFPVDSGESKTDFKRRLKSVAEGLFPGVEVTLSTADALLIAHYGRKVWGK